MRARRKKEPKEKLSKKLAASMADSLQVPKDLAMGAVVATITGQTEAYIENYRGILEYTDTKIRLQTKTCRLEIIGSQLQIIYYTNDDMKIIGRMTQINYLV